MAEFLVGYLIGLLSGAVLTVCMVEFGHRLGRYLGEKAAIRAFGEPAASPDAMVAHLHMMPDDERQEFVRMFNAFDQVRSDQ